MSMRNFKTSGWMAFDREQRRKLGIEPEAKNESFPSILRSTGQVRDVLKSTENKSVLEKPFVSVLQCSVNFPALDNPSDMGERTMQVGNSSKSEYVIEINGVKDTIKAHEILKELHPWADQSLIEDVLAGVNDNVDKASTLMKLMVSSEQNGEELRVSEITEIKYNCEEALVDENKSSVDSVPDLTELSRVIEGLNHNDKELINEGASSRDIFMHNDSHIETSLKFIKCVPIEPEWADDDVYLVHRKDARRMIGSATQHSKAASDAYLRGDHVSAQLYSQKAREEWIIAQRLNAKAAKEILAIRNSKNDEWTLDLHGLHALEAVQALQAHLMKIESQIPMKQLACASRVNSSESRLSAPPKFDICTDAEKLGNSIPLSRPRPTSLQVITGKGNHSRGEAAIPAAIRSFLIDNGYRYDEARPGMIEVKPKFRR